MESSATESNFERICGTMEQIAISGRHGGDTTKITAMTYRAWERPARAEVAITYKGAGPLLRIIADLLQRVMEILAKEGKIEDANEILAIVHKLHSKGFAIEYGKEILGD